jgi:iron complex outermembrane receptor protein
VLSVFGKNLLDEVARNHSSFVKDEVPLAGRNLGARVSYSF